MAAVMNGRNAGNSDSLYMNGSILLTPPVSDLSGRTMSIISQSLMLTGIIAAVVGVAAAVFVNAPLAGLGFGLLGLVSILGVFTTENTLDQEHLQDALVMLDRQNRELCEHSRRIDQVYKIVMRENTALKGAAPSHPEGAPAAPASQQTAPALSSQSDFVDGQMDPGIMEFIAHSQQVLQDCLVASVTSLSSAGVLETIASKFRKTEQQIQTAIQGFDRIMRSNSAMLAEQISFTMALTQRTQEYMMQAPTISQEELFNSVASKFNMTAQQLMEKLEGMNHAVESNRAIFAQQISLLKALTSHANEYFSTENTALKAKAQEHQAHVERLLRQIGDVEAMEASFTRRDRNLSDREGALRIAREAFQREQQEAMSLLTELRSMQPSTTAEGADASAAATS